MIEPRRTFFGVNFCASDRRLCFWICRYRITQKFWCTLSYISTRYKACSTWLSWLRVCFTFHTLTVILLLIEIKPNYEIPKEDNVLRKQKIYLSFVTNLACSLEGFVAAGSTRSFGILFVELVEKFQCSVSEMSTVLSVHTMVFSLSGMRFIS